MAYDADSRRPAARAPAWSDPAKPPNTPGGCHPGSPAADAETRVRGGSTRPPRGEGRGGVAEIGGGRPGPPSHERERGAAARSRGGLDHAPSTRRGLGPAPPREQRASPTALGQLHVHAVHGAGDAERSRAVTQTRGHDRRRGRPQRAGPRRLRGSGARELPPAHREPELPAATLRVQPASRHAQTPAPTASAPAPARASRSRSRLTLREESSTEADALRHLSAEADRDRERGGRDSPGPSPYRLAARRSA